MANVAEELDRGDIKTSALQLERSWKSADQLFERVVSEYTASDSILRSWNIASRGLSYMSWSERNVLFCCPRGRLA